MKLSSKLAHVLTLGFLGFTLIGCAGMKHIVVHEDNDSNWERSVKGSFVVYRISMSGVPPYTEIIVPDAEAANAFSSLVPQRVLSVGRDPLPAVRVWSLDDFKQHRTKGIIPVNDHDRPQAEKDLNQELGRFRDDLKDHSAVVLYYWTPPTP